MNKKTKIILALTGVMGLICIIAAIILNNRTYTITFDTDGGNTILSQKVKKGSFISKPDNPTKTGYDFLYWTYNGKEFDFTTKVDKDMTLKAMWEEEKNTYKVILEVENKKQTIEVKEGKKIDLTKLTFEEKIGYEIKWYLNDKEFDIEKENITEEISLTGKYVEVKTYIVTFNSDGGSKVESQKVNENKTAKEPAEPTKEGYVFDSWYLDNKKYDFKEKVLKDITLKAKWIEDKNTKKYTVTFNSDGGSNVASQTIIENKRATKPNNPTRSGYTFVEWQLNGKTYDFNSTITKDITLKAVWKQVVTFTVKFNSNGGNVYQNQVVESGGKATNPGTPTKSGYVFMGWNFDFNTAITKDITISATWRELYKYTVKFNLNGGSCTNCDDQTITEGNKATKPNNPTRSGYNFNGWDYDFNNVITSDKTINAQWQQKSYTIRKTSADNYSPDVILSVEENGIVIEYSNIMYGNTIICTYSSPAVNRDDISGITSFNVTLSDGTVVSATVSN